MPEHFIEIVNKAIDVFGAPIYVKHEVVHHKHVIEDLEKKGFQKEVDWTFKN